MRNDQLGREAAVAFRTDLNTSTSDRRNGHERPVSGTESGGGVGRAAAAHLRHDQQEYTR